MAFRFGISGNLNILFKITIFLIISKKNNQSLVSDADQEIPTLGSMDNARNKVYRVWGITFYPRVGISWSASKTDDGFYLY